MRYKSKLQEDKLQEYEVLEVQKLDVRCQMLEGKFKSPDWDHLSTSQMIQTYATPRDKLSLTQSIKNMIK